MRLNPLYVASPLPEEPIDPGFPEWVPTQSGEIRLIAGPTVPGTNTLLSVNPRFDPAANSQYPGDPIWHGQAHGILAFSGISGFAATVGEYGSLIYNGGGHQDSGDNSVYRFDLKTRQWIRMSNPHEKAQILAEGYPPAGFNITWGDWEDNDNSPHQPHTYAFNQIVKIGGKEYLIMPQKAAYGQLPWNAPGSHVFDLTAANPKWERFAIGHSSCGPAGFNAYDTLRNRLWYCYAGATSGVARIHYYDLEAGTSHNITSGGLDYPIRIESSGVYHEAADMVIHARSNNYSAGALEIRAILVDDIGSANFGTPPSTGSPPTNIAGSSAAMGVVYCPLDKAIYTVNDQGIWRWNPPEGAKDPEDFRFGTWSWELVTTTGASVLFEDFQYRGLVWCPMFECFIGFEKDMEGHVYAYKP